jgi:hypothetical protein
MMKACINFFHEWFYYLVFKFGCFSFLFVLFRVYKHILLSRNLNRDNLLYTLSGYITL